VDREGKHLSLALPRDPKDRWHISIAEARAIAEQLGAVTREDIEKAVDTALEEG
jgi:hypothetical protein